MPVAYVDTLHQTLIDLMQQDESIITIGGWETPLKGPSVGAVMGPERVITPPVSEIAYCGAAIGAAVAGMKPIVTFNRAGFMLYALEQLINEASIHRYMSGGQINLPLVIHAAGGAYGSEGAQHAYVPQATLWNTPGLKLVLPSTPSDLDGLLRTAVADPNPVVMLQHPRLYETEGDPPENGKALPFGVAAVRRLGSDITIVATSWMVHHALAAAQRLSEEGIESEVIDPRTLVPFDDATIVESVQKTGRLVVADESHISCGVAAEIAARIGHAAFRVLKSPIERVGTPDVPIPFSPPLERAVVPASDQIVDAVRSCISFR
jgi:pyruvate dehydrogenase E1 component beta subunit